MAVRFDAAADRLLRTSDLINSNAVNTVCFWVRIVTDPNSDSTFFALISAINARGYFNTTADGTTISILVEGGGGFGEATGANLTVGTWYRVTVVRNTSPQMFL